MHNLFLLKRWSFLLIGFAFIHPALQAETSFPARARLFGNTTDFKNDTMNTVLQGEGLKKIKNISGLGLEISTNIWGPLEAGLGYQFRVARSTPSDSLAVSDYSSELGQQIYQLVVRINVINSGPVRLGVVGAAGGTNTEFKIQSAGQTGNLLKSAAETHWIASPISSYGVSAAVGYKWIFLMAEAGYEQNKVEDFNRTGNISSSLKEIDFTGPYARVGLFFDGITGTRN